MKKDTVVLFACLVAVTGIGRLALATECRLDSPIYLGTDDPRRNPDTDQGHLIRLTDAVFDHGYHSQMMPQPGPADSLEVELFEVQWEPTIGGNKISTGWLGALIQLAGRTDSLGLSFDYGGRFNLTGSVGVQDGTYTYKTTELSKPETATEKEPPRTSSTVIIRDKSLLSLELTFPVRQLVTLPSGASYSPYLGENETLCLKAAKLKQ